MLLVHISRSALRSQSRSAYRHMKIRLNVSGMLLQRCTERIRSLPFLHSGGQPFPFGGLHFNEYWALATTIACWQSKQRNAHQMGGRPFHSGVNDELWESEFGSCRIRSWLGALAIKPAANIFGPSWWGSTRQQTGKRRIGTRPAPSCRPPANASPFC